MRSSFSLDEDENVATPSISSEDVLKGLFAACCCGLILRTGQILISACAATGNDIKARQRFVFVRGSSVGANVLFHFPTCGSGL